MITAEPDYERRKSAAPEVRIDQSWVQEQLAHFPPGSMDGAVMMIRAYEKAERRTPRRQAGEAA
ncbi:hypothetical protein NDR87_18940 [Nocardia sp. CDC159]|uniref:Uncharacterized protein n=1 Tax=Nocardia pulmonis TaxID=2951408 RepID=A0A9X2E8G4_9NOCA|nr:MULTISPECIES: hypothetical protein [Nocardia]MCM6776232.1 hypothetical protein [Nocardia pulmonis]MCM6788442.1 hypothetical protein [Nocardia sp. CDC159]